VKRDFHLRLEMLSDGLDPLPQLFIVRSTSSIRSLTSPDAQPIELRAGRDDDAGNEGGRGRFARRGWGSGKIRIESLANGS